jgi:hypothetical protein
MDHLCLKRSPRWGRSTRATIHLRARRQVWPNDRSIGSLRSRVLALIHLQRFVRRPSWPDVTCVTVVVSRDDESVGLQDTVERSPEEAHSVGAVFGHRFTAPGTRSLGKINGMRREPGVDARCIPFAKRYPTTMPREELGSLPNQTDTCPVGGQDHSGSLSKQFAEPSRVLWRH